MREIFREWSSRQTVGYAICRYMVPGETQKKFGKWKLFSLISWGKRWFLSIIYVSRTAKKLLVINSAFVIFPFVMKVFSEKRTKARCFYEIKERDLLLIASISCQLLGFTCLRSRLKRKLNISKSEETWKDRQANTNWFSKRKASFFNYGHRSWPFVVRLY